MKRLLVDIDGVVGDFVGEVLYRLNRVAGTSYARNHVTKWAFFGKGTGIFSDPTHSDIVTDMLIEPGFVADLPLEPGAIEVLERLSEGFPHHEIVWASAPYTKSPTWCYDRTRWVNEQLGHISKTIVYTADKHLLDGDVLIDDKIENVLAFVAAGGGRKAMLFDQPWNRKDRRAEAFRVLGWEEIEKKLRRA